MDTWIDYIIITQLSCTCEYYGLLWHSCHILYVSDNSFPCSYILSFFTTSALWGLVELHGSRDGDVVTCPWPWCRTPAASVSGEPLSSSIWRSGNVTLPPPGAQLGVSMSCLCPPMWSAHVHPCCPSCVCSCDLLVFAYVLLRVHLSPPWFQQTSSCYFRSFVFSGYSVFVPYIAVFLLNACVLKLYICNSDFRTS